MAAALTTDASAPGPVGPWRLVVRLGAGAFGSVWRAVDDAGRIGVVKLLPEPPGQEVRALSRVHHPAVVGLIDAGGTPPYLVMTLAPGIPLGDTLTRLTEVRRLEIVATLADALAACHVARVTHGDVKPENVMVAEDRVTLVDFGLSDRQGGTPQYAAPEVLDGAPSGPASDVYSLGMLAWELMHGVLPHAGQSLHESVDRRRANAPTPTAGPSWVRDLIPRMLAPDPTARPTAAAVADAFDVQGFVGPSLTAADLARRAATLAVPIAAIDAAVDRWLDEGRPLSVAGPARSGRSHALRRAMNELRAQGVPFVSMAPSPRPWGPVVAALKDPRLSGGPQDLPDALDLHTRAEDAAAALQRRCGHEALRVLVDDLDLLDAGSQATVRALVRSGASVLVTGSTAPPWIHQVCQPVPWTQAEAVDLYRQLLGEVDAPVLAAVALEQVGGWPGDLVDYALAAVRHDALRYRQRAWVVDGPALEELDAGALGQVLPVDLPEPARVLGAVIALLQPVGRSDALALSQADEADLVRLVSGGWVREANKLTCADHRTATSLQAAVPDLKPIWRRIAVHLRSREPIAWASLGRAILGACDFAAIRQDGPRCVRAAMKLDVRDAANLAADLLTACPTAELAAVHIDAVVRAGRVDEAREAGLAWLGNRAPTRNDLPALLALARLADMGGENSDQIRHWTDLARSVCGDGELPDELPFIEAWTQFREGALGEAEARVQPLCDEANRDSDMWLPAIRLLAQIRGKRLGAAHGLVVLDTIPAEFLEDAGARVQIEAVRARLQWLAGRPRDAAATYSAVAAERRAMSTVDRARNENNAAVCWYSSGDAERAVAGWERALLAFENLDSDIEIARVQVNLCQGYADLGRWDRAVQAGESAIRIAQARGLPTIAAVATGNLGEVACWRQRYLDGERHYDQVQALIAEHGLDALNVELARRRAALAALRHRPDTLALADEARALARSASDVSEEAHCEALRAVALAWEERREDAEVAAEAALQPLRRLGAAGELALVRLWVAEAFFTLGDHDKARRLADEVVRYADEFGRAPLRAWADSLVTRTRPQLTDGHRHLELLTALNVRVATQGALEDVLTELAAAAVELVDAQRAFVVLVNGDELQVCAAAGDDTEETRPSMSVVERALTLGRDVVVTDIEERADLRQAASVAAMDLRAAVCVPLFDGGTAVGALYLDSREQRVGRLGEEVALVRSLASHASVAVSHARLTAEVQRQVTRAREVAHDLRNPLSGVLMMVEDLVEGMVVDSGEAKLAADALRHALELVEGTLSAHAPPAVTFPWDRAVKDWVRALEPQARAAGVLVDADTSVGGRVTGRPSELRRALTNLVANAIKYSPVGGRIVVRTESEADRIGLAVEDEGPGIPDGEWERVFEIGVQGPRAQPGHGLGLAIARRICREHGGDVFARRRSPVGSRFTLWLPRVTS